MVDMVDLVDMVDMVDFSSARVESPPWGGTLGFPSTICTITTIITIDPTMAWSDLVHLYTNHTMVGSPTRAARSGTLGTLGTPTGS